MERRGFLKGLLGTIGAGTALVKLATPSEALMLKQGEEAIVATPQLLAIPEMPTQYWYNSPEIFMQGKPGEFHHVGYLRDIHVMTEQLDASIAWGGEATFIPGLRRVSGRIGGPLP